MRQNIETGGKIDELFRKASGGDIAAYSWLCEMDVYIEKIQEFLDSRSNDPHQLIALFAATNLIYSMPFYSGNAQALRVSVIALLHEISDSIAWANHHETWKKRWSENSKLSFTSIVVAVATMKIGFVAAREISVRLKELAWASIPETKEQSNG